ncbi:disease resistance protein RPM1 isoform X3 [Panicum miliaceum]|uniref:Disease resistance protein RPM1 isoform X3 n=1 Tax=Panicum miliaceum TaxID=4540 RepID=A0A3L6QXK7_PANMI|nr:disease resistance protein RPM1 isoform X3 [Panicum miliaceum]
MADINLTNYDMAELSDYYLGYNPDHEIRRGPSVRRWEAEGFISEVHSLSLEEIAKDYFDGFVSRSIVAPEQLTSSGEVRSFKVHDIMLDIITAKSTQENLMSTLGNHLQSAVGHDEIRRVSIQPGSRDNYFSRRGSLRHVCSLTIMGSTEKPKDITFSKLKLLRVLDLEGCRWPLSDKDWKEICNLSLLKYLSIRRTGEYVHYTRTHSVKHLAYKKEVVKIPPGLSKMKALKRISYVDVKGKGLEALQEVAKLSQLSRLCAMQTDPYASWGDLSDTLSDLNNSLRYLSVMQDEGNCNIPGQLHFLERVRSPPVFLHSLHLLGRLGSLPPWFPCLSKLASLSLRHNYLGPEMVDLLGRLPSLVSLKLYSGSYTGTELRFASHQFPVLKQLVIDNLPNLVKLGFESGAPGNLERLTLFLPRGSAASVLGIRNLLKLRAVELFGINDGHVVNTVMEEVNSHPNKPIRVTRDDQPPPPSS